jgi:predicted RNA-binding Zn ribbon-like protein
VAGVDRQRRSANDAGEPGGWLLEFPFRAGRLCLDFVATLGSRKHLNLERLRSPADLGRWFDQARLGGVIAPGEKDLRAAISLREAIHAAVITAPAPPAQAISTINRAATKAPLIPRLDHAGRACTWSPGSPVAAALSTIARDAIDLLSGPLIGRVRECAGTDCTILFIDTSRPGTRRWCAMEVCGSQAKAAGLRAKRRRRT